MDMNLLSAVCRAQVHKILNQSTCISQQLIIYVDICWQADLVPVDLPDPEEDHVEGEGERQQELQHRSEQVVRVEPVALLRQEF